MLDTITVLSPSGSLIINDIWFSSIFISISPLDISLLARVSSTLDGTTALTGWPLKAMLLFATESL